MEHEVSGAVLTYVEASENPALDGVLDFVQYEIDRELTNKEIKQVTSYFRSLVQYSYFHDPITGELLGVDYDTIPDSDYCDGCQSLHHLCEC